MAPMPDSTSTAVIVAIAGAVRACPAEGHGLDPLFAVFGPRQSAGGCFHVDTGMYERDTLPRSGGDAAPATRESRRGGIGERVGAMQVLRRSCAVVLISGLIALGGAAAPAAGQGPIINHDQFHETRSEIFEGLCDLTLRLDLDIRGMFVESFDPELRGPNFTATTHGTVSWTNLANNLSMTTVFNEVEHDLKLIFNEDGTLTVVKMFAGGSTVEGPNGEDVGMDTGTFRIEILVDHQGTPDPTDDVVLDEQVIMDTGQNLGDFCEDIHEFIG
jgi:hypothetical protein